MTMTTSLKRIEAPRGKGQRRRCSAAGYVLLEALVAVLVAAVGFIGAARLQTLGLAINNSAQVRQKAVLLAYEMADRVRANQVGMTAHAYDTGAVGDAGCMTLTCTPAALAGADIAVWNAEIAAQLPGGQGIVCVDSTPDDGTAALPACDGVGNVLAVKLWWVDKLGSPRFVTVVRP